MYYISLTLQKGLREFEALLKGLHGMHIPCREKDIDIDEDFMSFYVSREVDAFTTSLDLDVESKGSTFLITLRRAGTDRKVALLKAEVRKYL